MRKGVSGVRRIAAILSVSTVALLATGAGAGAVTLPKLANYSAVGKGQVLNIHLQLPAALKPVLQAAHLSNVIDETVSFSRSIGQVDRAGNIGNGLGQMFDGTLNPVLEQVSKAVVGKALPRVFASLGEVLKHDSLAEINVPGVAPLGNLVHVGVSEVNAVSRLENVAGNLKAVVSHSDSKLLGIKVDLGETLTSTLKSVLQPVLDITDKPGGLIDTINNGLAPVTSLVDQTLGINVNLNLPKLEQLLSQPLATIGVIETGSDTGYLGAARNAKGVTRMADVDLFGTGDNALVHIDSLSTETAASIDGTKSGAAASAVNRIVGLKILGNTLDLTKGALKINGKSFALPLDTVLQPLQSLLKDTLGLNIDILGATHSASPTHAFAEANTLKISLAPSIAGNPLGLALAISGPGSMVDVSGSPVSDFNPRPPLPTTGVPTTTYFVLGSALIGMTILVRRFALAR